MSLHTFYSAHRKIFVIVEIILLVVALSFGGYSFYGTYKRLGAMQAEFASSSLAFRMTIQDLQTKLASSTDENTYIRSILSDAQLKNVDLQVQAQDKQAQINTLTKLTTIDPELLKKYSKTYFLNENYVPAGLLPIDPVYVSNPAGNLQILDKVQPFLQNLLIDANTSGVPLSVASAYRSFGTQSDLKAQYKVVYGAGTANSFSADQGYSEHQLGTAVDFSTPTIKGAYPAFEKSTAYTWLNQNAYKYGFIISYPRENTYYEFEPWHWRFVGVELATYLHDNGMYFYEMDQRQIDAYLLQLFDQN